MNLFFSYGRDENKDIVYRLQNDLEQLYHHEVFVDKRDIKKGHDWRRELTEAIMSSDITVSFASHHALRSPGVCLDELSIAVSVKGAMVCTVLLEKNIEIPGNLFVRQCFDMSDWKEKISEGVFEDWYQEKLKEISDFLASDEIIKYNDEILFLREFLNPKLKSRKQSRLETEAYIGRRWLSEKVKTWLTQPSDSNCLLITGDPGVGKSTFMANEFLYNQYVGAILFCQWDESGYDSLDSISRSLIFQLATRLNDYRFRLVDTIKRGFEINEKNNGQNIFKTLFVDLLKASIDGNRETIAILIDGIDEVVDGQEGSGRRKSILSDLFEKHLEDMPKWLRFILTSRDVPIVTEPLEDVDRIHIHDNDEENLNDVKLYLHSRLNNKYEQTEIDSISEQCAGNFLYAKLICNGLLESKLTLNDVVSGKFKGLKDLYLKDFDHLFQNNIKDYTDKYRAMFEVLCASKEKTPYEFFVSSLRLKSSDKEVFTELFNPYLSLDNQFISLYHKSLRDWLLYPKASKVYAVDVQEGKKTILEECYRRYKKNALSEFEMKYLMPLLEELEDSRLDVILNDEAYGLQLVKQADSYHKQRLFMESCRFYEMAIKIYENRKNDDEYINVMRKKAASLDFLAHLDESREIYLLLIQKIQNNENKIKHNELIGNIYLKLAYVEFRQSNSLRSLEYYDLAISNFRMVGDESNLILALVMKLNIARDAEKFSEAEKAYEELLMVPSYQNLKQTDLNLYIRVILNYGWLLLDTKRLKKSEKYIREGYDLVKWNEEKVERRLYAQSLYVSCMYHYRCGNYEIARDCGEESFEILKQLFGRYSVQVCSVLNQLGGIYTSLNNPEKALKCYKHSMENRLSFYGERNKLSLNSIQSYAKALLALNDPTRYQEAEEKLKLVEKIRLEFAKQDSSLSFRVGVIKRDLGEYYLKTKQYDTAIGYFDEAIKVFDQLNRENDKGACYDNKGKCYYEQEEYLTAKEMFELELENRLKYLGEAHPYTKNAKKYIELCDKNII